MAEERNLLNLDLSLNNETDERSLLSDSSDDEIFLGAVAAANAESDSTDPERSFSHVVLTEPNGAHRTPEPEDKPKTSSTPPPPKKPSASSVFSLLRIPHYLGYLSPLKVPLTIKAEELLELCRGRVQNPDYFEEVYVENDPQTYFPPSPPRDPPTECSMAVPLLEVQSAEEVSNPGFQKFCESSTILLIRNLPTVLEMNVEVFHTENLVQLPDHEVEVRTQVKPKTSERNFDAYGQPTWRCLSIPSRTTLKKYGQMQSDMFGETVQKDLSCQLEDFDDSEHPGPSKKPKRAKYSANQFADVKTVEFGTNIDLADREKFECQLNELKKLPPFMKVEDEDNLLSHLGYDVIGMNTVQLYMKIPGVRTPGHLENNCLASVNINVGPGDCEWFGIDRRYIGPLLKMLKRRRIDFLNDSWWPDYQQLIKARIPVFRFIQKNGDVVWVNSGCIHWVQSNGCCNNVAWNVGPMSARQYKMIALTNEWNKTEKYMSLVPVQHLSWRLAERVAIKDKKLYKMIRRMLIRSLSYCKMVYDTLELIEKPIRQHPRFEGDGALYCSECNIEVWNLLFVKFVQKKYSVYCLHCALNEGMDAFIALYQQTFDELSVIFDNFQYQGSSEEEKEIEAPASPRPLPPVNQES